MAIDTRYHSFEAIVPHASNNQTFDAIYVGVGGNIAIVEDSGRVVIFLGAVAGDILPISGIRVNAISTTATDMVALRG